MDLERLRKLSGLTECGEEYNGIADKKPMRVSQEETNIYADNPMLPRKEDVKESFEKDEQDIAIADAYEYHFNDTFDVNDALELTAKEFGLTIDEVKDSMGWKESEMLESKLMKYFKKIQESKK